MFVNKYILIIFFLLEIYLFFKINNSVLTLSKKEKRTLKKNSSIVDLYVRF